MTCQLSSILEVKRSGLQQQACRSAFATRLPGQPFPPGLTDHERCTGVQGHVRSGGREQQRQHHFLYNICCRATLFFQLMNLAPGS